MTVFQENGGNRGEGGREPLAIILIYSVGSRNSRLKGRQARKRTWMEVRRNADRTRSDLGRLWGVEAGMKGKDCCIHSNFVCSLYGERNKGNSCLQTPNAATVCVDVFCRVCVCLHIIIFVYLCA